MRSSILLLALCVPLAACGGETDEASVPVEAEAPLAPELADGLSVDPEPAPTWAMPEKDGDYAGEIALVSDRVEGPASVGDVRVCTMTDAGYEERCYVVELSQHRDGSLYGDGALVSVRRAEDDASEIAPADRTPVEMFGHIDNDDVVHLEWTDGGQTRYARYDTPRTVDYGDGFVETTAYEGRTSDGTSVLDYEVEYGD